MTISLRILESPTDLQAVEQLQRQVWPGSELDIVPVHMLLAAVHGGGLVIGATQEPQESSSEVPAFGDESLIGFVFGFPGIYQTPDGPRLKHYSHMLGVHPAFRNQGLGFRLKRAQWQMVRRQGIDRITWTYDPLLSPNAWLNINRLGAVCSTYHENFYGLMRDGLNQGLDSDRFEVDWWINTRRVEHRLSREARPALNLQHYQAAETPVINPARWGTEPFPKPGEALLPAQAAPPPLVLAEIPANFTALRQANIDLAYRWRVHTRQIFQALFDQGYLVTGFVASPENPRSAFYVLAHGEAQIGGVSHDQI